MCLESNVLAVLAAQHRDNRGLSREEAELQYIREAVLLEAPLNAHLYRLRRSKNEAGPGRILLAICARGVRVYAEEETPRVFAWNNIGKLCFDVSFVISQIADIVFSNFCYCTNWFMMKFFWFIAFIHSARSLRYAQSTSRTSSPSIVGAMTKANCFWDSVETPISSPWP